MKTTFLTLISLLFFLNLKAQQKFTLSGTVRDAATGEAMIGATVRAGNNYVTTSNAYGYYALTMPQGQYTLTVTFVGYEQLNKAIVLNKDQRFNPELKNISDLEEVVVRANARKDENVRSAQMGLEKVDMKALNNIPVLLGEKDVLRSIQLLPGVKSGGEGNTGFYVRGGASDQNLILLDEAVVYNSSHLLGFFSTFNADAVKDVSLYKGGMPAQYGGRLSSVLDVKMNEGNYKNFAFQGGIGLIASRIKAEGPLIKDKASFMFSARRTYLDVFLKASSDSLLNGSALNFYDINAKMNYKFDDRNILYISGYFGKDNIGVKDLFQNNWGNVTTTIRYNHIFNNSLFSNTSLIYNNYNFSVTLLDDDVNFKATSLIRDFNLKQDFQYFVNKHAFRFGLQGIHHRVSPIEIESQAGSSINPLRQQRRYGIEAAAYISDEWTVSPRLNLLYGLRFSAFSLLGPGTFNNYDAAGRLVSTEQVGSGTFYKSYYNLEPRLSLSYRFTDEQSFKASYNRNTQNIHILSNSNAGSPADQYVLSSNNIRPEIADQFAVGYFRNFAENAYEFSTELYYKSLDNQIEYKNGAELLANTQVESELLYGTGRAYGIELFFKKKYGKLNGWVGYTLSRTERQFAGINDGNYFPAKYDRTHDVAVVGIYNLNQRWTFSGSYIYGTGNAVTYPAGKYQVNGTTTYYYTERNGGRMPYNSRLDLSATLEGKPGGRFQSSWSFGVYNVLNRKNPYSIDFRNVEHDPTRTEAVQTSLFGIIPSVTWNFKF
ncbi:TonB-dependent receptor [Pedobacter sp. SYP-B3415]|uniref:TonB-dependent receptor n=1 Tax=Pedobacter sp. SYP-B3415 TaxID=2496641 RepID=UPI001F0E989C|nr:TonB-dependent receptor [Pedobacter sp. SYP-B3415]